jgi:hypothetical protein
MPKPNMVGIKVSRDFGKQGIFHGEVTAVEYDSADEERVEQIFNFLVVQKRRNRLKKTKKSSTDSEAATATKVFILPFLSLIINHHDSVFVIFLSSRNEPVDLKKQRLQILECHNASISQGQNLLHVRH